MNYIELNRTFSAVSRDEARQPYEDLDEHLKYLSNTEGKSWSEILKNRRTVILAKAGAGKTEELRFISYKLHQDGIYSFFLRLENIESQSKFELAFEIGNITKFNDWLESNQTAYFFLDSIDEAKLKNYSQFSKALKIFNNKLGAHKQLAKIFITSRPSEWNDIRDRQLINQLLGSIPNTQTEFIEKKHFEVSSSEDNKLNLLYLNSLVFEKVEAFINGKNVTDKESLLTQLHASQEDVITDTPKDLIEVIHYWNKFGKIGSRFEMLEESINNSLLEQDPNRSINLPISKEKLIEGVELLASAVTFTKISNISTIEFTANNSNFENHISPKNLLDNWNENEIRTLLQRRVFEKEVFSLVRFDHRSIREYLTAKWVNKLLETGAHREEIENIFVKDKYGLKVISESLAPVLAWVVLVDKCLLEKVVDIDPILLVKEGDASQYDDETKVKIIHSLIKYTGAIYQEPLSFYTHQLRRLSSEGLADTIIQSLKSYKKISSGALRMLLDLAAISEIAIASKQILKIIFDKQVKPNSRRKALKAISKCGSKQDIEKVIKYFLESIDPNEKDLYGTLIEYFSPEYLGSEKISDILRELHKDNDFIGSSFDYCFRNFIDSSSEEVLETLLSDLDKLIKEGPFIENEKCKISKKHNWLFTYALHAIKNLINHKSDFVFNNICLDLIRLLPLARRFNISYLGSENDFKNQVRNWDKLNYALFWRDVFLKRMELEEKGTKLVYWYQSRSLGHVWSIEEEDFDYFLEQISERESLDDKLVSQSICFHLDSNQSKNEIIKDASLHHSELIDSYDEHKKSLVKTLRESPYEIAEEKRRAKMEQRRSEYIQHVKVNSSVLREKCDSSEGQIYQLQSNLISEMRKLLKSGTAKWGISNWQDLIAEFGDDVANSFKVGAISFWREYTPELLSKSHNLENRNHVAPAVVFGLTGLALETTQDCQWLKNINEDSAIKATRYALREINGFPDWFETLFEKFQTVIFPVIEQEIKWEIFQFQKIDYVLSNIVYRDKWLIPYVVDSIIKLLKNEPAESSYLHLSIELILSCEKINTDSFIQIANNKLSQRGLPDQHFALWLAASMCVDSRIEQFNILSKKLDDICEDEINIPKYENKRAVSLIQQLLVYLTGSKSNSIQYEHKSYQQHVDLILGLIKLSSEYMPRSKDINRIGTGVFSPDIRDESQDARDYLTQVLRDLPGIQSYEALISLSETHPEDQQKKYYKKYAVEKAIKDAEFVCWTEQEVSLFHKRFQPGYQLKSDTYDNLTNEIKSALMKLQGNREYWNNCGEVPRNRYINDMLQSARIVASQEKPWSISSAGKSDGEVDIFISDNQGNPFSIFEALNLATLRREYLNLHLDKIFSYDSNGLKECYIVTYSSSKNFQAFWNKYFNYIKFYKFEFELTNFFEIDTDVIGLKQAKSEHMRAGRLTKLNHFFLDLRK